KADQIEWLAGVRAGETLGSPIAMLVWNRDWEHWQEVMAPEADEPGTGGAGGGGGRAAAPGDAAPTRARRARGLPQVRSSGRARHPRAGERARDRGPRCLRRGVQGVPGTVRRGSRFSRRGIRW